jgi:O-antigen ligase
MFKAQIEMAKLYPFGTGQRGSEVLSSRFLDKEFLTAEGSRSSHNAFMTVLVEQGIPGAVMFLLMVGWTALTLRKVPRYSSSPYQIDRAVYGAAVGGALTVVLVGGLFADFSKAEVQIWMLALLAGLTQPQTAPVGQAAVTEEVPASGGYRVVARPDHSS